jgi:hypothetical protein
LPDDLSLLATATVEFTAPLAVVREQFFDLDQHVREHIYHGHELSWAPKFPPEARRLRMLTRILGRNQEEDFVIEEGDGGAWVRRYVDGVNTGAKLVAKLSAVLGEQGDGKTRVRLEGWIGPKGFVSGLGKLSKSGMEKLLAKILGEHQRAIEGYQPSRPRGSLGVVMVSLRELATKLGAMNADQRMWTIQTLLELGSIVAIADGEADDAERAALSQVLEELCKVKLPPASMAQMIQSAHDVVAAEGIETRCAVLGQRLASLGIAQLGVEVAALVALVSHGLDLHELSALACMAEAAGLSPDALDEIIAAVDRELSGEAA